MSEAFDGAGTEAPVQKTSMPTLRQPRLPLLARLDEQHDDHRQATWLELFFDLFFIAVSHFHFSGVSAHSPVCRQTMR